MENERLVIVGAGLAGLLAAHAWPGAAIFESASAPAAMHRALLRFRSDAVARLTGVEFRKVLVRKGVWSDGSFTAPTIRLANLYSRKVIGSILGDRSIWNLDAVERYIAPDSFYEELVANAATRIQWGTKISFGEPHTRYISTAPLPEVLEALGTFGGSGMPAFRRAPITIIGGIVGGADVYQTVYFPDIDTSLYRISITGSTLIAEFAGDPTEGWEENLHAFGIQLWTQREKVKQRYGKIAPVPDDVRKMLLFRLTHDYNIFSLGRFATWRNILLDDVVTDIDVVKRLMRAGAYERRREMS